MQASPHRWVDNTVLGEADKPLNIPGTVDNLNKPIPLHRLGMNIATESDESLICSLKSVLADQFLILSVAAQLEVTETTDLELPVQRIRDTASSRLVFPLVNGRKLEWQDLSFVIHASDGCKPCLHISEGIREDPCTDLVLCRGDMKLEPGPVGRAGCGVSPLTVVPGMRLGRINGKLLAVGSQGSFCLGAWEAEFPCEALTELEGSSTSIGDGTSGGIVGNVECDIIVVAV